MRRSLILIVFLTACAGAGVETTTTGGTDSPVTTSTPSDVATTATQDDPTATTSSESATTTTDSGREVAPDFTLDLGDGGTYTLSEGEKPVYMIFWAEW